MNNRKRTKARKIQSSIYKDDVYEINSDGKKVLVHKKGKSKQIKHIQ